MSAFVPLLRHFVSESATPLPSPVAPIDVEAERAAAYRAGHDDAERACAARLAELEQRLAVAVPLLDEVARARREALDRSATDVGEMVIAFARKVVGDSLTVHPDALIGVVRAALDELPDEDEVWVRVAPDQVERGMLHIEAERESLASRMVRRVLQVLGIGVVGQDECALARANQYSYAAHCVLL